jgi:hypothetical protein
MRTPVRAIAYFSWEESSRVFLARRVYPTFFNFLSYSQCPERWGAAGNTLGRLLKYKDKYFDGTKRDDQSIGLPITEVHKYGQAALPFLSEADRLNYKALFVIPVVEQWGRFSGSANLEGVFIVFLNDASCLPSSKVEEANTERFRTWLGESMKKFQMALLLQAQIFDSLPLPEVWRKLNCEAEELYLYELTITSGDPVAPLTFGRIVSDLIATLGNIDYYATLDQKASDDNKAVLLVAPAATTKASDVRANILRAAGSACHIGDPKEYRKPLRFIADLKSL